MEYFIIKDTGKGVINGLAINKVEQLSKQDALTFKTINGNSILGNGNLVVSASQNLQQVTDLGADTTKTIRANVSGDDGIVGISDSHFGVTGISDDGIAGVIGAGAVGAVGVIGQATNYVAGRFMNNLGNANNILEAGTYDAGNGTFTPKAHIDIDGNSTSNSFIKQGGLSTEFLKADGSVDSGSFLSSTSFVNKEIPTGLINGVNTTYTLINTPIAGSEHIYRNGVLQESGAGNDYTISGATITYLTAPLTGDKLRVTYRK